MGCCGGGFGQLLAQKCTARCAHFDAADVDEVVLTDVIGARLLGEGRGAHPAFETESHRAAAAGGGL